MTTSRYAELFRAEARERLAEMNTSLLAIERGEGSERVVELFRAVHTVKGMSAAMGYEAVRDLSHSLEALLDRLRRGVLPVTPSVIDVLFESVDTLETAIGLVAVDARATMDVSGPVAALDRLVSECDDEALADGAFQAMDWPSMRLSGGFSQIAATADAGGARDSVPSVKPDPAASVLAPPSLPAPASQPALRSVRVSADRLDDLMTLIGELVIVRGRLQEIARAIGSPALTDAAVDAARLIGGLQREITTCRMVPVGQAFERFERMVRDTAHSLGKQVIFDIQGSDIEVDKSVLDEIGEPVMHLLRNALDHGVETPSERRAASKPGVSRLTLAASRQRSSVVIEVTDDGRGIDVGRVIEHARLAGLIADDAGDLSAAEVLALIARPGFSTTELVTSLSGRGVGLDVVATKVRSLGGSMELATCAGGGTTIRMELPTTLAIIHALLARSDNEIYALPITHVRETLMLEPGMVRMEGGREVLSIRGEDVSAVRLRERVGHAPSGSAGGHAVVLELPDRRVSLLVDEFIGQHEVVVKPFDAVHGMPKLFNGATILTNGMPALILDAQGIAQA